MVLASLMASSFACAEHAGRDGGPGHLYLMEGDGMMLRRQNVSLRTLGPELQKRGVPRNELVVHIADDASPTFVRKVYRHLRKLGYISIETRIIGDWFIDRLYPK
jgi:hypothetical protein